MRAWRLVYGSVLFGWAWLASLGAHARAAEHDRAEHAEQDHRDHIVLGMKGVNTVEHTVTAEGATTLSGFGFASVTETSFLHGRLGLEVDFVFTALGDELAMAGEPMVKLPWHLRSWLEPYVATGPVALRVRDSGGQRFWLGGGQLVFGAFLWLGELAGIDLDVALGAARGPEMAITELTIAIGPVLRD